MVAVPMFGDQMSNSMHLEEANVGRRIHFREEPLKASELARKAEALVKDPSVASNLERLYQISARSGGAKRAADVVEDAMMLGTDHLVPASELVSFPSQSNADLIVAFTLLFAACCSGVAYLILKTCRRSTLGSKPRKTNGKIAC
jgi:hypothetical protein